MIRLQRLKIILLSSSLVLLFACAREFYDITYTGRILDSESRTAIPHCTVKATCYFQQNIDKISSMEIETQCDEKGVFKVYFPKGHKLKLRLTSKEHLELQEVYNIKSSITNTQLYLTRKNDSIGLRVFTNEDKNISDITPFIRIRYYKKDSTLFPQRATSETYGYDFINAANVTDLNEADIWISKISKSTSEILLKTQNKGGLHPIFYNEINNDIWNELTQAPLYGYTTEYTLTGKEIGFFVRCRNGINFAKIVHEKEICTRKVNNKLTPFIEQGIRFDYLFQSNPKKANIFLL